MTKKSPVTRKVKFALASAILTLLALGALSWRSMVMANDSERWVRHTYEVVGNLQSLASAMQRLQSSTRGFLLTGRESYIQSYDAGVASQKQFLATVRNLTADNPGQQARIPILENLAAEQVQITESLISLRRTKGLEVAADAFGSSQSQPIMSSYREMTGEMEAEELRLLALRNADASRRLAQTREILILGIVLGLTIGAAASWAALRESRAREIAEEATHESEQRFRAMANNISQLAWMADENGYIFWYNDRWFDYTGTTLEEMAGWGWQKVHDPDHVQRVVEKITACFKSGEDWEDTFPLRGKDGTYRLFLSRAVAIRDSAGKILRWFGTNTDISERQLMEDTLFEEKERAQVTLNSIGDAVICTDISGKITFLNRVAEQMTGWSWQEAARRPMAEVLRILDGTTRETVPDPMEMAILHNRTMSLPLDCILVRRDEIETPIEDSVSPIHDREGRVTGAVIVFRDVSAARAMTIQITHTAQHDVLTGLPNRALLSDRINQAIALAGRRAKKSAVMFLDLDGFKHINDSLGHPVGDKLLQSIAKRLSACVRGSDTVSRQGGDEFVVLLSEMEQAEDAAISATRMLKAVAEVHSVEGHDLHVTTSIGVSVCPDDGADAETLIKNADTAMYQAKENGRQSYQFFKAEMNIRAVERQSIESSLRTAVERQEFTLHYQPKVSLATGEITGAEALIRWTHPVRGLVSPADFIPVAEDCGLIVPIGNWALHEACRQARAWADAGLPLRNIAVNISAMEFRDDNFLEGVFAILRSTGLDPGTLELELTESVLMKHAESTEFILQTLRAAGVQVTIDDFGTGYSSLSYLKKFPVDALKIDQSFIRQINSTPRDTRIVTAVINMGRSLNLRVVAEGVETMAELEFLRAHQCDEAQGYYFSRPVPSDQFARLLETGISEVVPG